MTPEIIAGSGPVLLVCDHASNHVPNDIPIPAALLDRHIAIDIGAAALTRALASTLGASAVLGSVSRLVVDLNRQADSATLVPHASDGHELEGNKGADRFHRIAQFYAPYHHAIAKQIRQQRPRLMMAIHSFTPRLEVAGSDRPWQIGILSNRDRRAANPAIAFLQNESLIVGDNEPYSGKVLNATLNRHAEGQGIPSISIEVRNDLISNERGVAHWCQTLTRLSNHLASEAISAT